MLTGQKRLAVYEEIPSDHITPVLLYQALSKKHQRCAILESVEGGSYSFIGFDPVCIFSSCGKTISIEEERKKRQFEGDPIEELRKLKEKYAYDTQLPASFMGGAIGFFSYDSVRLFERLPSTLEKQNFPDILFHFYSGVVVFDHKKKTMNIISFTDDEEKGRRQLENVKSEIRDAEDEPFIQVSHSEDSFDVDLSDEEYAELVKKAKEYIRKGDIFQVVLSREFSKPYHKNPFHIYRSLRIVNPSPYLFYLDCEDFQIAGGSPEQFISVQDRKISSKPIAGTRKRGKTEKEDHALAVDLLQDEKEVAEHMMLVDLARNDVGRVSKPGTVQVEDLKSIVKFSHVMHIESEVTGELEEDKDALDAAIANFPAGTLTGAPKIRAMEIIEECETSRRKLYGGAILTFDGLGNLNSCIAIRMALIQDHTVYVRAGAGIVYDSDPKKEAEETLRKAHAVLQAIDSIGGES